MRESESVLSLSMKYRLGMMMAECVGILSKWRNCLTVVIRVLGKLGFGMVKAHRRAAAEEEKEEVGGE